MLTRAHRFHGHNSLRPLYQKGKSAYSVRLKLLWGPTRPGAYRVAVVVSKKVHKSAVVRNRIRRRIFEFIRQTLPSDAAYDLIFIVQDPILAGASPADIQAELLTLLKKMPNVL